MAAWALSLAAVALDLALTLKLQYSYCSAEAEPPQAALERHGLPVELESGAKMIVRPEHHEPTLMIYILKDATEERHSNKTEKNNLKQKLSK